MSTNQSDLSFSSTPPFPVQLSASRRRTIARACLTLVVHWCCKTSISQAHKLPWRLVTALRFSLVARSSHLGHKAMHTNHKLLLDIDKSNVLRSSRLPFPVIVQPAPALLPWF